MSRALLVLLALGVFLPGGACSGVVPGGSRADADPPRPDVDLAVPDGGGADAPDDGRTAHDLAGEPADPDDADAGGGVAVDGEVTDAAPAGGDEDAIIGEEPGTSAPDIAGTDGEGIGLDGPGAGDTDGEGTGVDGPDVGEIDGDVPEVDAPESTEPAVHPPEHCAYFLSGEVDLEGTDADGDGVSNGWDHCPNNPFDWLDSDRDGIGNRSDPDMDGDGLLNDADLDRDGDGVDDAAEQVAGTDPADPSSLPGLRRFDLDPGVVNPEPGWYLGDLHVHVEYSHDSSSALSSYVPGARSAGLDFLCITDHDVFEAPFDAAWNQTEVLFVPGIEWGGAGGHANMWGIRTFNDAVTDAPDDIRRSWHLARMQGGIQSLNHYGKEKEKWDALFSAAPDLLDALDVVEVWNLVWAFQTKTNEPSIALWERLLTAGRHVGAVGGGDSHTPVLTLGSPTTAVWAESLTVPGILHGIRSGRTYVTQADPLSFKGRPELDFRVDADGDGVFEAMLGDEVRPGPVILQVNVRNAKGPVVLVRNGAEFARFEGHSSGSSIARTVADNAPPRAWYRVEMRETALPFSPMRLFSSAIYVGE